MVRLLHRGDMHDRWKGIVRRLPQIDMVVRVDRLLAAYLSAEDFNGGKSLGLTVATVAVQRSRLPFSELRRRIPKERVTLCAPKRTQIRALRDAGFDHQAVAGSDDDVPKAVP